MSVLMCPPLHYKVNYSINVHMKPEEWKEREDHFKALTQWMHLRLLIKNIAPVIEIEPDPECPDMVFTANYGIVVDDKFMAGRFLNAERRKEEPSILRCMKGLIPEIIEFPHRDLMAWEGAGDTIYDKTRDMFWHGHGFRSHQSAGKFINQEFGKIGVGLQLIDPYFYHLDTAFHVLPRGEIVFYPDAFVSSSIIRNHIDEKDKIVTLYKDEARAFSANMFSHENMVIMSECSDRLRSVLEELKYDVYALPLTSFHKAGGSAACLTLKM